MKMEDHKKSMNFFFQLFYYFFGVFLCFCFSFILFCLLITSYDSCVDDLGEVGEKQKTKKKHQQKQNGEQKKKKKKERNKKNQCTLMSILVKECSSGERDSEV